MSGASSATALIAVAAVPMSIVIVSVLLRLWLRRYQNAQFMADDFMMLAACISLIGVAITIFIGVHKKVLGYKSTDFTKEEIAASAETQDVLLIAFNVLEIVCLGCTKASAALFYWRVFIVPGSKTFRRVLTGTLAVIASWIVTFCLLAGLQCGTHFSALWNGTYGKYCVYSFNFLYALVISDPILDLWLLCLPVPKVLAIRTTVKTRLSVLAIFSIGFAALAAGLVRMVIFIQANSIGSTKYAKEEIDAEVLLSRETFYVALEVGLSTFAINLISLWPLFSKVLPEAIVRGVRSLRSTSSTGSAPGNAKPTSDYQHYEMDSDLARHTRKERIGVGYREATSEDMDSQA